jgi:hypothetical protein
MKKLLSLVLLLLLPGVGFAQACTSTLNPGADVAAAIQSAPAGAVICLNSGSYGAVSVTSYKSGRVILRSTTGVGATLSSLQIYRSRHLQFKNLTVTGSIDLSDYDNNCSGSCMTRDISFVGSVFGTGGPMALNMAGMTNANILIYGNTIGGYDSTGVEGTVAVYRNGGLGSSGNTGVTIMHNTFDGTGACADGIQIGTSGGVSIGPGNIFRDWVQGACGPHVDAIQGVGAGDIYVFGNYFENNTINIGYYDGGSGMTFTNNIVNGQNGGGQSFQMGGIIGFDFSHNTLKGVNVEYGSKAADPPNSGWVLQNNILVGGTAFIRAGDQPGCGSNCIIRYNVVDGTSTIDTPPTPTNTESGTPTFVGGASPSTWAGWKLTGSVGVGTANDGKDRGTTYFNPAAPSNFQAN